MTMRYLAAAVLLLAACSSPATQTAAADPSPMAAHLAVHPESGLKVVPLTVTSQDGKTHIFRVEVALSGEEQAKGLMFRTEMGPDEGMIFPRRPARPASFWMKNTVIPLDLLFVGPDGRITNIAENAVPYSLDPIESTGLAAAVLELNGGRAAELGIEVGDLVEWDLAG